MSALLSVNKANKGSVGGGGGTKLFQSPPKNSSSSFSIASSSSSLSFHQNPPKSGAGVGVGIATTSDNSQGSQTIALRGSVELIVEFFNYCVNSILYQRGPCLYPPESYKRVSKYGLTMHLTTDADLITYLAAVSKQLEGMYTQPKLMYV